MRVQSEWKRALAALASVALALQLLGTAAPKALAESLAGAGVESVEPGEVPTEGNYPEKGEEVARLGAEELAEGERATAENDGLARAQQEQAEREEAEQEQAVREKADRERAEREQAEQGKNDSEPAAAEQEQAEPQAIDREPAAAEQEGENPGDIVYVDEGGNAITAASGSYELVTDALEGQDVPTLTSGVWVVAANVEISKRVKIDGEVTLVLCDGTTFNAKRGVNNGEGSSLEVYGTTREGGALVATADKTSYGAGIGGSNFESGGTFVMHSGKVTASGCYGAGIGGGANYVSNYGEPSTRPENTGCIYGGTIDIRGGIVDASCDYYGAGIGGGAAYREGVTNAGNINISGGTVTATAKAEGAAIGGGGGWEGETHGAEIVISGGTIVAISQSSGAGIGAGRSYAGDSSSGNITITGGDVTAKSGWYAAGIGIGSVEEPYGGPYTHQAGEIVITGGTVHAYGAYTGTGASASTGPGIGSCKSDVKGLPPMTVTIGGDAYVEAYGGNLSAGIGGSNDSSKKPVNKAGTVNINGGTVKAYAGNLGAGIGGGEYQDGADVTITGGVVEAYGDLNSYYGGYGAGIGGGNDGNGGTCTITGGHVLAVGGSYAAGIGGGGDWGTDGGTTIIEGGEVEAHGGKYAAGIGGADYGNGGSVTISGGTVVAEGGELGPGIGSGCKVGSDWSHVEDNTCTVSITGGDVTATGSASGAGIGFGDLTYGRASMTINISDGTVRATGGTNASGIGFGKKQEQAGVTCVVDVTGGTVTATSGAGDGTQAIGVGSEPMGSTEVQFAIYPAAKVLHGTQEQGAALSLAANRVADCRDPWAQISPCQHEGVGYTPTQDKLHHVLDCPYCLGTRDAEGKLVEHDHEWVECADGAECACSVKAYRVSFDANGAGTDGSMATSDLIIEEYSYDIPECGFTRTGYDFSGWNTAADGSGQGYADGARIASVASGVTLYAQWAAHTYKVAFDKNAEGATGSMAEQSLTYDEEKALTKNGFSRTGYTFAGWNTVVAPSEAEPGTPYSDEQNVSNLTAEKGVTVTLHAQWRANRYKVVFSKNAEDATGTMAEQELTYDAAAAALTPCGFSRTGYAFAGWNTAADGSGDAYDDRAEVRNLATGSGATVTLHAQWEQKTYTVSFDPNGAEMDEGQREQQVKHGEKARRPAGVRRQGYVLAGWLADGSQEPYDFDAPVTGDLELTAKWDELGPVDYVDEGGAPQTRAGGDYEALTEDASGQVLSAGWYAVLKSVTLDERVEVDGEVHLILCDGAKLTAKRGVNVSDKNSLWLYGQDGQSGELETTGPEYAAGIGGSLYQNGGDVVLAGAKVTAQGGKYGAGIGSGSATLGGYNEPGRETVGGNVTVYAGEHKATGGVYGAGVGAGDATGSKDGSMGSHGGTFKILGGKMEAHGGDYAAGIGSGRSGGRSGTAICSSYGGTFKASGGVVEAWGGKDGAGIGTGSCWYAKGIAGIVNISGDAEVFAYGGDDAAGIGTGKYDGIGPDVTITGGKVTALGGKNSGAGIGCGAITYWSDCYGSGGWIKISGGEVVATAPGYGSAGIGGGDRGDGAKVTITGGEVTATGGNWGPGVGGGVFAVDPGSLEMSGGKLVARAGSYGAAGIGSSQKHPTEDPVPITVTITGGEVWAYGGYDAAGIGGGEYTPGGIITISGGKVVADGRSYQDGKERRGGAGIGSGYSSGFGGTIVIEGDAEVTAIGGQESAGLGASDLGEGADVTIRETKAGAPKVTARGGAWGAGIGGSWYKSSNPKQSGSLTVEGDVELTAIGGTGSAGIGGGRYGPGANVAISGGATVTAQAGAPSGEGYVTQAIGHGELAQSESTPEKSGGLAIYPEAKVMRGAEEDGVGATASLAAERVDDCRNFLWAQISPCQHEGVRYTPTQDNLHHVLDCPYCLGTRDAEGKLVEHDHEWVEGADGAECACSVKAHRVSFDANGAGTDGSMDASDWVIEDKDYTIPACAFTRTGYDFSGWNTAANGSGAKYADEATLMMGTANVTLYAQWTAHTYKVAFEKNAEGATGTMGEQAFTYDAEQALAECGFSRTGYDFSGWNTKADGSGQNYADKAGVRNLTDKDKVTVVLYAQWAAHKYKVAFDKNAADATGTMAEQGLTYGADPVALAKNAFRRTGHTFAGWNTKADGKGDAYPDGAMVADLASEDGATVTLYAQWKANTYTVAFDVAGGSAVAAQKVSYGQRAKRPAGPTKGAWTFGGWYADAALKSAYDFSKPVTANLTLHAKWSRTSIAKATMAKVADQAYTAKAIQPKPAVKLGSKTLRAGTDFAYSYKNNVRAGTATVTATGKGAYSGSASRTFRIVAPAGSATATLLDGRRSTAALGKTCGTVGKSMTMTSLALSLAKPFPVKGGIEYRTHVQTTGWEKGWKRDGAVAGNPKQKKRLEGIQVRLYGDMAKRYDVYYRAHVQRVGWMAWAKNGTSAGTQSGSRRMEAIQVVLVPKGAKAPANTGAATKAVFVDWSKTKSANTKVVFSDNAKAKR